MLGAQTATLNLCTAIGNEGLHRQRAGQRGVIEIPQLEALPVSPRQ